MATTTDSGIISLTAKQLQTARGAVNAVVELIDAPDIEIDDQFDPVRRDHAVAVGDALAEAQLLTAADGNWSGRVSPSEQQALRDALGAIEAMVTHPRSARLESIPMRIDDDDMRKLSAALDGVPAPDREDLAWSDHRYGGSDRALQRRTAWDTVMPTVRQILGGRTSPPDRYRQLRDFDPARLHGASCKAIDRTLIEQLAIAASLHNNRGYGFTNVDVLTALSDNVETILDGDAHGHDCYDTDSKRRIRISRKRIDEAVQRTDPDGAQAHAFAAAEMVLWAQSNRLREQRIGLR